MRIGKKSNENRIALTGSEGVRVIEKDWRERSVDAIPGASSIACYKHIQDPSGFVQEITTPLVPFTDRHSYAINCPMKNMITVVTRFQLPARVNADRIHAGREEAAPGFSNVPGLVRKQFLRSKDCRTAGGVYSWNDEAAARAFMSEHVAPMIRKECHVGPTIEFYDSPVIVEN